MDTRMCGQDRGVLEEATVEAERPSRGIIELEAILEVAVEGLHLPKVQRRVQLRLSGRAMKFEFF